MPSQYKNNDLNLLLFHTHTLKGNSGNISALQMEEDAQKLEIAVKKGRNDSIVNLIQKLEKTHEETLLQIAKATDF